ncbi:probable serine/threonine-protein kinase DDB_G0282963 [Contarinia nasturtii]|uniref:probable serine/threonine-protein kinase DDB_G0282963 n=1 Tax=Contarinia nasturtii TaxID=265458 RepID=UPI0012D450B2|nr:probable serine/threonine-protein kinase DDB_G0282963 [Contarinia nasturtii]
MNGTMIMSLFHCSKCLMRTDILVLFILTLTSIIIRVNAFNNDTPKFVYNNKQISNIYTNANNNNNMNNRFRSIRQVLYHTPYIHQNETSRWQKINSGIFKYRVKRKTKTTVTKISQSSGQDKIIVRPTLPPPTTAAATDAAPIRDDPNNSTNIMNFSHNKQIPEILSFVNLNMLLVLNQKSIHNILVLNLSGNGIKEIEDNVLKSLENVRRLDLSQNQINVFNVSMSNNNKIKWLSVSDNQLVSFNGKSMAILKFLDLSCNHIQSSSEIHLNELNELEYVNLSGNRLNIIQQHVFQKLIKLKVINLSYNRLKSINNNIFRDLNNIESLDMSYNQISFIENDSFSHLMKLQYLDLSYNQIETSSLRALQGIPNLIKLSIAFNTKLGGALQEFISSWSLNEVNMSGTGLCEIPNALAQSVHTLNISNNNFAVIRCGDLDSYPLLQELDVSSCQIFDIEDDALGRLDLLVSLHLNNNNIAHVPSSLPVNLVRLFLQNNRIAEIQASAFSHLVNLEVVNLSGNQITYLPSLPLPKLLLLDLRSSRLKRLSQSIIKMSPRLKVLFLDENPIKCTELQAVAEWATPCRINDDSFEVSYSDDDNDEPTNNEISTNEDDDDTVNNYKLLPKQCQCKLSCRSFDYSVQIDKLHCNRKHLNTAKRTRMNETSNIEHTTTANDGKLNEPKEKSKETTVISLNVDSMQDDNIITMNPRIYDNQINNVKLLNEQNFVRMNDTSLSIDHDIQLISTTGKEDTIQPKHVPHSTIELPINTGTTIVPTDDNLISLKLTTQRDLKQQQFNENIITNDNLNTTDNTFMLKVANLMTIVPNKSNVTTDNLSNQNAKMLHQHPISLHETNQNETRYDIKTISSRYDKFEDLNTTNLVTPQMVAQAHIATITTTTTTTTITEFISGVTTVASSHESTTENSVDSSVLSSPLTSSDDGNIAINYEQEQLNRHPKSNDSDHKENKSEVNWNINKAISTTNDMASIAQQHHYQKQQQQLTNKNLSISVWRNRGNSSSSSNMAESSIHINEINKNQLTTEGNQVDAEQQQQHRTVNDDTMSREIFKKQPHDQYSQQKTVAASTLINKIVVATTTTKQTPLNKITTKVMVYSNSFAKNGMLINDRNNNDYQHKSSNYVSNNETNTPQLRKNETNQNQQNIKNSNAIELQHQQKHHEENAHIEDGKLLSISSPILNAHQELANDTGKVISTNIKGDNFRVAKEIDSTKASLKPMSSKHLKNDIDSNGNTWNINSKSDGDDGGGYSNERSHSRNADNEHSSGESDGSGTEQMQQINNTATFATEINEKEKPLIGSISQNVSIIDNEHQFERYNNIEHSMHEQDTVTITTTAPSLPTTPTTTLQSANDNVQAHTEDRYDNREGIGSNINDNSTVHTAVSEQWYDDKCATSGHSALFVVICIGISVLVTFYFVHMYRCKKRYNLHQQHRYSIESMEQLQLQQHHQQQHQRQSQNLLIGMQMEMLSSKIRYTDTPIDLW